MSKLILGDGLLGSELQKQTGWDYISVLEKTISNDYSPEFIILPKMSFFWDDLDLRGVSAYTITEKFNIPVVWC